MAATIGSSIYYKIAGVSGTLAVALGAYGAHAPSLNKQGMENYKKTFETGNLYHLVHTLALLAVPFTNKPHVVGTLMGTGMLLFSGSCYLASVTKNRQNGRLAPFGGTMLMISWLAILL